MNCSPILTAEDFKNVHNGLCDIRFGIKALTDILSKEKLEQLTQGLAQVEKGLRGAYEQDNDAFKKNSDHYDEVGDEKNFNSNWSIYEVPDLRQPHTFVGAEAVLYEDHWGTGGGELVALQGNTWVDLWAAADKAIHQSGDDHHVFIESFHPSKEDPSILILGTGS